MSLNQLLLSVLTASFACWVAWFFILFNVDPQTSGFWGIFLFYLSLFLSLTGTIFAVSSWLRNKRSAEESEYRAVSVSFRQSIFFSLAIVGVLFLQSKQFLTWWNLIILICGITLLEYLFLSLKKKESVSASHPEDDSDNGNEIPPYIPPDF